MNKSLYTVKTFVRVNTSRVFRDPIAIFFTIIFPLIFLFVFGSFNSGSGNVSFRVALINQSSSSFAKNFVDKAKSSGVFKINDNATTLDQAKDLMTKSQLDAAIVLPKDFGTVKDSNKFPSGQAQVIYTQNNSQSGTALAAVMTSQFSSINNSLVKTETPFTVKSEQLTQKSLAPFDYTFAGLLGFSIIGMGIFGPINVFPELKKMGILRRLSTTPLKVWQYFMSTAISQLVVGIFAFAAQFLVAILVFHLHIVGNWLELIVFLMLGVVTILGIGLALGGWAKNERQAAPLSNIIVFPMMFLSGTFFPRFLMPEWLQNVSAVLPLTPIIEGIRLISTEGKHLWEIGPQLGLIGIWVIVIYFIAFRVFRWE
jgi:ABC-2 type transport system permease protein